MDWFLPLLLGLPLIGAVVGSILPSARASRIWALGVSLSTLLLAVVAAAAFNWSTPEKVQFAYGSHGGGHLLSIPSIGFAVRLGMDSISLWLVLLTALLSPLAIAASFDSIRQREREYYAWMLGLLFAMLGVFIARDALLFYVFFELTLIPMFFIIGIWGGPERRWAAGKFFLFTFAGSIFTLAALIYLGIHAHGRGFVSFNLVQLIDYAQSLDPSTRYWLMLGLLVGFAVKVPLFPVHTWLPLAHTEAPTAGSVILAGVLLKLGTYGLLRLAVPIGLIGSGGAVIFPGLLKFIAVMCIIGIIYGALVAWVQKDIKKLVAYSSVSHLGFCVLGLMALNIEGMQGSVMYMINHGLSTGALFLVVGMIYDRYHTRDIDALSGLARRMPRLAFFFVFFALASVGLPGLNGFVNEFLCILGTFISPHLGIGFASCAAVGVILGAIYLLHMVARVIWGPLKEPHVEHDHAHEERAPGETATKPALSTDIGGREIAILVPIALLCVLLGVLPSPMLKSMERPLRNIMTPMAQQHHAGDEINYQPMDRDHPSNQAPAHTAPNE